MPAIVKGACGKGGKNAPGRDARKATHDGEQSQRGNNRARCIKLTRMNGTAHRQFHACDKQRHKIGREHAKGHAKTRNVNENTQRNGNDRRKRCRCGDRAVSLLTLLPLVQHGYHTQHRRDNEACAQADHKSTAPNEQVDTRRKRTQQLTHHSKHQSGAEVPTPSDNHAEQAARKHKGPRHKRIDRTGHLHIRERAAKHAHHLGHGDRKRPVVGGSSHLGARQHNQRRQPHQTRRRRRLHSRVRYCVIHAHHHPLFHSVYVARI